MQNIINTAVVALLSIFIISTAVIAMLEFFENADMNEGWIRYSVGYFLGACSVAAGFAIYNIVTKLLT